MEFKNDEEYRLEKMHNNTDRMWESIRRRDKWNESRRISLKDKGDAGREKKNKKAGRERRGQ
jgi:hypothetical protein